MASGGVVTFLPIQAEGTPSPENPIPVYPRLYIDGIGAIWGGSINADEGILYSEWKQIDLGTINWDKRKRYEDTITLFMSKRISDKGSANIHIYCPIYPYYYVYAIDYMFDKTINDSYQARSKCIEISNTVYDDYTTAEFKAAMSGVTCVYKLATPVEYHLTAPQLQQAIQQLGLQMPSALEMRRRVMMAGSAMDIGGRISGLNTLKAMERSISTRGMHQISTQNGTLNLVNSMEMAINMQELVEVEVTMTG